MSGNLRGNPPPWPARIRWGFIGAALLALVGAGLWAAGAVTPVAAATGTPYVATSAGWVRNLCFPTSRVPCNDPTTPHVTGATYVPPADAWVIVVDEGLIVELSGDSKTIQSWVSVPCEPWNVLYFGSGSDVYIPCRATNTTFVLAFDAVHGNVSQTTDLRSWSGCGVFPAFNGPRDLLYCPSSTSPSSFLLTVDLGTGSVVANVSLPAPCGDPYGDPCELVADPVSGTVVYAAPSTRELVRVDPGTGRLVASSAIPGIPTTLSLDSAQNSFIVQAESGVPQQYGGNISFVNRTTLAVDSMVPTPALFQWAPPIVDGAHHDVLLAGGKGVVVLNESTGAVLGSVGTGWFLGRFAYDPRTDTICGLEAGGTSLFVPFVNLTRGSTSPGAFTAVPVLGSLLPVAVLTSGILAASGVAVAGLRFLRSPDSAYLDEILGNG